MARWGKNLVVPLDSMSKEKDNANRPTVVRTVGTVGKWGTMGFTSTRTYMLSSLPPAVAAAAAAAAAAASPGESPASAIDDDMSPSVPEPPKPKKFFKSRNTAPPEVIAQIIQNLPRTPNSPHRSDSGSAATPSYFNTPTASYSTGRDGIKINFPKSNSAERKKKSPKKLKALKTDKKANGEGDETSPATPKAPKPPSEPKSKKKKEDKKLKPEAPPSRVLGRARKAVNYCEEDDDERYTSNREILLPKSSIQTKTETEQTPEATAADNAFPSPPADVVPFTELPPPAAPPHPSLVATSTPAATSSAGSTTTHHTSKTPEHPPIVLRISKGTSRLVSTDTDSEEQPVIASPQQHQGLQHQQTQQHFDTEPVRYNSRHASIEEVPATPKIIVKPPKPPTPEPTPIAPTNQEDEPPEINYCTVKISPDKPPKERLKLIIKTDVIRNAIAAAAAAAAAKAAAAAERAAQHASSGSSGEGEKEKKQKSKKHKHLKHLTAAAASVVDQLTPSTTTAAVAGSEFKTPSPHLALGVNADHQSQHHQHHHHHHHHHHHNQQNSARTVISPPTASERDFDSQSSVLGSISSKGNSTPQQPLAQTVQEESCVIHSRGSSVITSDLETSQHSSLVAAPSDIESRLESMMMDGEASQRGPGLVEEEPLQEDILAVLRGDESQPMDTLKMNGNARKEEIEDKLDVPERRVTRGRGRGAIVAAAVSKTQNIEPELVETVAPLSITIPVPQPPPTRTRGKKAPNTTTPLPVIEEPPGGLDEEVVTKRTTRRGAKKSDEHLNNVPAIQPQTPDSPNKAQTAPAMIPVSVESTSPPEESATPVLRRGGRLARNASNNNNVSNNNNNINKIAATLQAKAVGANAAKAKEAALAASATPSATATTTASTRSYGRKRKNQQVEQSPEAEEAQSEHPTPAKVANVLVNSASASLPLDYAEDGNSNSNSTIRPTSTTPTSPLLRHDYKVKDKFKRTLTLDNQVNCNAVSASPSATTASGEVGGNNVAGESHHVVEPPRHGSVKLVISKKKGSIFKSRALVPPELSEQTAATKRHLYKHRWNAEANGEIVEDGNTSPAKTNETQPNAQSRTVADAIFDDFDDGAAPGNIGNSRDNSPALGKLTRVVKPNPQVNLNPFEMDLDEGVAVDTITSVKVDRKAKEFYTVVRNVKTAHQIQEIGEYQEMDDDVEYILDALQPHNPTPTRCLSALQLATKCMNPAFRMHVRAHGVVCKFFKALSDANNDLSLGLCTSAIMYILSQEGLNMDLDRDSLELMMNLLESEGIAAPSDRANYERNKQKVRELCEEIKAQGKATHLNVDSITVGTLAMETLLSLTSKRAGEWFKEELRELGGLEHIIKTISDCCRPVFECSGSDSAATINWTQSMLDNMQTVERCMRVLENVTQMNEENQRYMLTYAQGAAVNTLCTLYSLCDRELMVNPSTEQTSKDDPGVVMRELLIPVMKVLINLTHPFNPAKSTGAELLGTRADVLETSFHLLLQGPYYIPDRRVFELSILVLLLLINLSMHSISNRATIMKATAPPMEISSHNLYEKKMTAVQAVMEYFYKCEELARLVEKNTDAFLESTDKNKKKQEEVDETVNNLLQKAGSHMEHTLKGSYAGILIGYLIQDNEEYEENVRKHLRGNGFKEIVGVLEKYYTFMNLTASSESSVVAHIKSTKKLIDYFKKRDLVYEMNDSNNCALPLNLEMHHNAATASSSSQGERSCSPTQRVSSLASGTTAATTTATAASGGGLTRVFKTYGSQR